MRFFGLISFIYVCAIVNAQNQLPIIKLNGVFGYEYQNGTVSIIYPDGSIQENLIANIKWRGGSTNSSDKHKRNYKIKFAEDQQFFGLRTDNKWILDAGQADVFRLRNRIATELWNDFATKPYYFNQEPEAYSGVRGRVVEVYLNDEYIGIYCLTECMDRKQMKVKKVDKKTSEIRGLLYKADNYGASQMNICPESYDNKSERWDSFEMKYPELDDVEETDWSILWNAIYFVVNSSDEEFRQYIAEYFDIPVIIDYYIFVHLMGAIDNEGKNMYWAVYDKTINKKLTLAVWDLDLTVGNSYLDHYLNGFSSPEFDCGNVLHIIKRLKYLDVDNFNDKVKNRYAELRKTWFSSESLKARYNSYYKLLKESGAAERETIRWSRDSDILGAIIDYDNEIEYIINWIVQRIKYLDNNVFNYYPSSINDNIIKQKATSKLYTIQGIEVKNKSFNKGLYITKGKKLLQK